MTDVTTMTDVELEALRVAVQTEQARRATQTQALAALTDLNLATLADTGRSMGGEWVQPTNALDAFPKNWETIHNGKTWVSLLDWNAGEPGVSGWREKPAPAKDGGAPAAPPEFVQPTGAHDTYRKGDRVTFNGVPYESTIDGNTWSPTDYPQGWKKLA